MAKIDIEKYREWYDSLTPRQLLWAQGKARWEQITMGAVFNQYGTPPDEELDEHGCWTPKESK